MVVTANPVICAMVLSVGLPDGFAPRLPREAGGTSSCDTNVPLRPAGNRRGRLIGKEHQIAGFEARRIHLCFNMSAVIRILWVEAFRAGFCAIIGKYA